MNPPDTSQVAIRWEKIPIFAGLEPRALEFLTAKAKEAVARSGEILVREGETGNRLFLIRSGAVRVRKGESHAVEIATLRAGDFFGEMCILETLPRSATVEALDNSAFSTLSSIDFYRFYESMPDQYSILVLNIARDLSRRLRRLDEAFAARG
jgi:CRP/FNR family transcriptional regulator, cyclic AMP receptor protein